MIAAQAIADVVAGEIPRIAASLRPDVLAALHQAIESEPSDRGRRILTQLASNAEIASSSGVPLCQDTGTVWVWVELGVGECIEGDLSRAVNAGVARAYVDSGLRMSVVRDALFDRANTEDNTPAFIDVSYRPGKGATVHVMLKGGGSDNASAQVMLDPAAGADGVVNAVVAAVGAKATGACPPLVVGVGVGGTFDSVAKLAKRALLRRLDAPVADERLGAFEHRLLEAVNATGIGPAGLGGRTTALAVNVVTAPCHIAALPVAVNLGCSAMRTATVELG
ncbi:MAG: fumarate hydratase [Coriobacteriia bacterium]